MGKHANNFDGLRLLAALAVLVSHMFALSGREQPTIVGDVTLGTLAVYVFFAISGYLVTGSWRADPDLGRFLARRFLRIAPALAVAMPVTYLIVLACGLDGFPENERHELNGSLWTIEYEVICYLVIAGAMLLFRHPVPWLAATWLVSSALFPLEPMVVFGGFFLVGAALRDYPVLRRVPAGLLFLLAAAAVFPTNLYVSLALVVSPLAVYIGTHSWPGLRTLGRWGDFSYGVYIYAWPVQQFVVATFGPDSMPEIMAISALSTLTLGALSWLVVEKPSIARKPPSPAAKENNTAALPATSA